MEIKHGKHIHTNGLFRSTGVFLDEVVPNHLGGTRTVQTLVPYSELKLKFTNPVKIRVKKANNKGLWYEAGQEYIAEGVNKGHTVEWNDYVLKDGRLLNYTDCEEIK
jgi:hypothetical protein